MALSDLKKCPFCNHHPVWDGEEEFVEHLRVNHCILSGQMFDAYKWNNRIMFQRDRWNSQSSPIPEPKFSTVERQENDSFADDKNTAAVELGRLGGKKGGPARAAALSPEERSAIARKAAQARWGKK